MSARKTALGRRPKKKGRKPLPPTLPGEDGVSDRGWKLARLACDLYRWIPFQTIEDEVGEALEIDGDRHDRQFMQCLTRAQFIMDYADGRVGKLHAADLFEEVQSYSIDEIAAIFKHVGFPNFSENKIRGWLVQIHQNAKRLWSAERAREEQEESEAGQEKMDLLEDIIRQTVSSADDPFLKKFPRRSGLAALVVRSRPGSRVNFGEIAETCRALNLERELLEVDRRKLKNPPPPKFRQDYEPPPPYENAELILHYTKLLGLEDSPWCIEKVALGSLQIGHDVVCPTRGCELEATRAKSARDRFHVEEIEIGRTRINLRLRRFLCDCSEHGKQNVPLPDIILESKEPPSA